MAVLFENDRFQMMHLTTNEVNLTALLISRHEGIVRSSVP